MDKHQEEDEFAINSSFHENPFDSKFIPMEDEKNNDRNSILKNLDNKASEKKDDFNLELNNVEEVKKESPIEERKLEENDPQKLIDKNLDENASKIDLENTKEKEDKIEIRKEQKIILKEIIGSKNENQVKDNLFIEKEKEKENSSSKSEEKKVDIIPKEVLAQINTQENIEFKPINEDERLISFNERMHLEQHKDLDSDINENMIQNIPEPKLDSEITQRVRHSYYYRNAYYIALIFMILGVLLALYDIIYFSIEGVSILMGTFNMLNYFFIVLSGVFILILANILKWGNTINYITDLTKVSLYVVLVMSIIHLFVQTYYLDTDPAGLPELIAMIALVTIGFPYSILTVRKIGKICNKNKIRLDNPLLLDQ